VRDTNTWRRSERWAASIDTSYGYVEVEIVRHLLGRDWSVFLDAYSRDSVKLAKRYLPGPRELNLRDVKALLPGLLEDIEKEATHKVGAGLAEVMP
jgi:hypothetical protein